MEEVSRRTTIKVKYQNKDITKEISPYVKSFSYSDAVDGEADSAQITLIDKEEIWIGEWFPEKGNSMEISITSNGKESDFGRFEIDEIENTLSPSEARIKLVSVPNKSEIRYVEKSRSWEKVKLSTIAEDIATESNLQLYYKSKEDPIIERIEQDEESDLKVLKKLCKNRGLSLKVSDMELIIYDKEELEGISSARIIKKDAREIKQFRLKTTVHEVYKSCKVEYMHGKQDKKISHEYNDASKDEGMTLKVSEKVENEGEAERLAKKKLREKNEKETTGSFTLIGDPDLIAGVTVELKGFHVYDGKYLIDKSNHDVSNGYTTKIEVHKCLEGY